MDHSHMDHSGMDHGMDHGGGGMDMGGDGPMCSMNMLFTMSTENLCIVFPQWRVTGVASLVLSLVAVAALTAGYEALREFARKYEARLSWTGGREPCWDGEGRAGRGMSRTASQAVTLKQQERQRQKERVIKGLLYAVQVFYSFFIMLLFMTYNGWIMLAVGVGAFVGYMAFTGDDAELTKSAACH